MNANEVARFLRFSSTHVRNLASAGVIPGARFGYEWRFRRSDVLLAVERMVNGACNCAAKEDDLQSESDRMMTTADVARLLNFSPQFIRNLARKGILPGKQLGSDWRFRRSEINRVMSEQGTTSPGAPPAVMKGAPTPAPPVRRGRGRPRKTQD